MSMGTVTAGTASRVAGAARPAQVVRRQNGRVVVILWGRDAAYAAADWVARGYRVEPITSDLLGL